MPRAYVDTHSTQCHSVWCAWLRPRCADPSRLSRVTPRTQGTFLHLAVEAQGYTPKSTTCDPAKYVPPPGEPGEEYAAREKIVEE